MSSSDQNPAPTPTSGAGGTAPPPGRPTTVSSQAIDMGAQVLQTLKPVRQMKQHACSFALYAHDMHRQLEVHHFVSRLNQDVLQCAVYDSDKPSARLIGMCGVHRVGQHLRGPAAGGAEAVALARLRGQGRAVDRRGRAGDAADLGDGQDGQDVRQVLVHVAGGPQRPAAPRRAGAHDVAAGRGAGPGARRAGARARREVQGGQLRSWAQG
uniref:Uncharacterized protein n=1 Tax=Triticum urartu TaxID=4572 RepID=A0A8R7TXX2_TRIUA